MQQISKLPQRLQRWVSTHRDESLFLSIVIVAFPIGVFLMKVWDFGEIIWNNWNRAVSWSASPYFPWIMWIALIAAMVMAIDRAAKADEKRERANADAAALVGAEIDAKIAVMKDFFISAVLVRQIDADIEIAKGLSAESELLIKNAPTMSMEMQDLPTFARKIEADLIRLDHIDRKYSIRPPLNTSDTSLDSVHFNISYPPDADHIFKTAIRRTAAKAKLVDEHFKNYVAALQGLKRQQEDRLTIKLPEVKS